MAPAKPENPVDTLGPPDLQLIAQRILQLAAIATGEHLDSLANSQAGGMLRLACESETA